jgi:hypothetical protein
MNARWKLRASLAAAALAAAVPAVAAEAVTIYTVPSTAVPATTYYAPATSNTYYYVPSTDTYYVVPATNDVVYTEAPIAVYADRATNDELITDDVGFAIASDPRISGTIGIDTFNSDVTLTGRVGTRGQKDLAEQDAKGVDGVYDVDNQLHARVGEM